MKTNTFLAKTIKPNRPAGRFRTACAARMLPLLLLLALPAAVQAQFNFITNNGAITITGYTGSGGDVTIPSMTNCLPVTGIGDSAFVFCTGLTNVTIPNSVTNIGIEAFFGCTNLTSVMIPYSVTGIGYLAFCHSANAIAVDAANPVYSSVDGVLFDISQTTLIQCPAGTTGSYTVPSSVTSIGTNAFTDCPRLNNVTIPNSVTSIGRGAFSSCPGLTSVMIGNGVTSLGDYVFTSCRSLISITIPNSVTSIGEYTFEACRALTSVTIPNSVTSIGDHAFYDCYSLTNVTIGNSVTSFGSGAFQYCSWLKGVYFAGNAPTVNSSVFNGDMNVIAYYLPGTTGWDAFSAHAWIPTAPWYLPNPTILNFEPNFGVRTNRFGFTISWATNISVVVEACTNFTNPVWQPVQTNTLTGGSSFFSDPQWTNYPSRFYRLRSP
jgi:hypothetical protein